MIPNKNDTVIVTRRSENDTVIVPDLKICISNYCPL